MISIQDLGLSIMSDSPRSLYIVGGTEYGIKDKYIDILTKFYGRKEEFPSVEAVISTFSVKHLVPIPPSLYVVRYDETFVSHLDAALAQKLKSAKIAGTLFCVYEDQKSINKADKFLPDYTCIVEPVNSKFTAKYLHQDFPDLDDRLIQIATNCARSYGHARIICKSMTQASNSKLLSMSDIALSKLFGCESTAFEQDLQLAIASRNFANAVTLLEAYDDNMDSIVYTILQTMIDMEKILTSKYSDSILKDYSRFWKLEDVYNMFMNAYAELDKLRSNTSTDVESSLIYLFGLFTFKDIPSVEVMNSEL